MAKKVKAERPKCKVKSCLRHKSIDGFCDICYGRFKRGFYSADGSKSPETTRRERLLAAKRKRRKIKATHIEWIKRKAELASFATPNKLKVLQQEYPNTKVTWSCKLLDFQTCDAMCFGRIFLRPDNHLECAKCHENDSKFDFLESFLKKKH